MATSRSSAAGRVTFFRPRPTRRSACPIARPADGSPITGPAIARFYNVAAGHQYGRDSAQLDGQRPARVSPAGLEQPDAVLTSYASENALGEKTGARGDSASGVGVCRSADAPFPGTPDPTRLCLKDGFDPARLYELAYTAKDPLVLGIGLAATRDIVSFFRHATSRWIRRRRIPSRARSSTRWRSATRSPATSSRHSSTSASTRICQDGASGTASFRASPPRQTPINFRFALPGGAATLYEPGSEPVVWWGSYVDTTRGRAAASLLDRCTASRDVPEGHRGVWLDRVLGASHVARTDRHRREARHPAAGQRATLLLSGHDARWRTRRIPRRRYSRQSDRLRPAGQSESGSRHDACPDRAR